MRKNIVQILNNEFKIEAKDIRDLIKQKQNLSSGISKIVTKNGHQRKILDINSMNRTDLIVSRYYQLLFSKIYKTRFPNRTGIMKELMHLVPYLSNYHSFTIFKCDFKNFFYNIDPKKILFDLKTKRVLSNEETIFSEKYLNNLNEILPGIGLHNVLIEIVGEKFDIAVYNAYLKEGLVYYARYVDDFILIFDQQKNEENLKKDLSKLSKKIFGTKMALNDQKTQYITSNTSELNFDFLGYNFKQNLQITKSKIKMGISEKKIEKIKNRLEKIIINYKMDNNLELLKVRLDVFYKRVVYYGGKKNRKLNRWQVRGLSQNYKELKNFILDSPETEFLYINNDTIKILNGEILKEIFENKHLKVPNEILNFINNKKYLNNFKKNKALLLNKNIGYSHNQLANLLNKIGEVNMHTKSYQELINILHRKLYL